MLSARLPTNKKCCPSRDKSKDAGLHFKIIVKMLSVHLPTNKRRYPSRDKSKDAGLHFKIIVCVSLKRYLFSLLPPLFDIN